MDQITLKSIKTAAELVADGKPVKVAVAMSKFVNAHPDLINRINALKQIDVLDVNTREYLFAIKLTDSVTDVKPKVDAIWQLCKSANLIDDSALDDNNALNVDDIPDQIPNTPDAAQQVAVAVINKLSGN